MPDGRPLATFRTNMAMLIFEKANGERMEISVENDPISIGRGAEADVDVGDLESSRHHCALMLWEDDWVIKDAHSRNGTWVNETKVPVAVLKDGDIIRIGKTDLDFHTEERQRGRGVVALLKVLTIPIAESAEDKKDKGDDDELRIP